jgi:hypothetical protein
MGSFATSNLHLGGNSVAWNSVNGKSHRPGTIPMGIAGLSAADHLRSNRAPNASIILKHSLLKSTRAIPRITVDVLVDEVQNHVPVLEEFNTQLVRFRNLTEPYARDGSVTYEKSVMDSLTYGTKDGSNRSLFRR